MIINLLIGIIGSKREMPFNERRLTVVNGGYSCRLLTNCVFSLILFLFGKGFRQTRRKSKHICAFKTDYKTE